MSNVLVNEEYLSGIADAIRAKNGSGNTYTPGQMAAAIGDISGGSAVLTTKNITQNGTYNASSDDADGYSSVVVNVSGGGSSGKDISYLPNSDSSKILCSMDAHIMDALKYDSYDSGLYDSGFGDFLPIKSKPPVEDGVIKLLNVALHVVLTSGNSDSTSYLVSKRNSGSSEAFIHSRNGSDKWPFFNNRSNAQYAVYNFSNTDISGISAYDWHLYAMSIDMTNKIVRFFCDGEFLGQKSFTTSSPPDNTAITFNGRDNSVGSNYGTTDLSVKYMGVVEDFESDATVIANMQTIMSKLGLTA